MFNLILTLGTALALVFSLNNAGAQTASIYVNASQVLHTNTAYMTGACLEDVNHEIYGGLYTQMIFGESFQEPGITPSSLAGFNFSISALRRSSPNTDRRRRGIAAAPRCSPRAFFDSQPSAAPSRRAWTGRRQEPRSAAAPARTRRHRTRQQQRPASQRRGASHGRGDLLPALRGRRVRRCYLLGEPDVSSVILSMTNWKMEQMSGYET